MSIRIKGLSGEDIAGLAFGTVALLALLVAVVCGAIWAIHATIVSL